MPGFWELLIIFCVFLLFFGAKNLPDLAKSLGLGIKEFKKAISSVEEDKADNGKTVISKSEESDKH